MDYLIVGAGFAGSVCARQLADAGKRVRIIDQRPHVAGNAHDAHDAAGVLVHHYGPHIFHTNSDKVVSFLSRFTAWRAYEHRVRGVVDGRLHPVPVNRTTINQIYGLDLDEAGVAAFLAKVREPREHIDNSEDAVLAAVGRDLCDKFFRGYTRKQWGMDLAALSPAVAARVPVRTNDDDRYFTDKFQAMPADGFTRMFERMLDHPNIEVRVGVAYAQVRELIDCGATIYSGPVDEYFGYRFGRLPYRSLRFSHEHLPHVHAFQPVGTVNYPNEHAFTRITEFKHLTGQQHDGTSIVREFPCDDGDPYYPVPTAANAALYKRYEALADAQKTVHFIGRLAQYRYYNMDQVAASALVLSDRLLGRHAMAPANATVA